MLVHLVFPSLGGTGCHQLCMTHQGSNLLWLNLGVHAAKLWEWLLPFKGKVLHRLSKIPGSEQQLHLPWEDNELPCGPHKKWTAQIAQELQHHALMLVFFFSKMCLMGSAHGHCIAEREWRCHGQLMDPNGFCRSVTLKSCCTVHCSHLAGDTFAAGELPCSIYFTKIGENVCARFTGVLFWSILVFQGYTSSCGNQWIILLTTGKLSQSMCADPW